MKYFVCLFVIGLTAASEPNSFQTLFPEQNRLYSYIFKTNVTTGTLSPVTEGSWWVLEGVLNVQVYDDFGRARFYVEGLKSATKGKYGPFTIESKDAAHYLRMPWEVNVCFTSIHVEPEPVWAANIKRALSFNFLLAPKSNAVRMMGEPRDDQYTTHEPCIHGICLAVYSKVGKKIRKYCSIVENQHTRGVSSYAHNCQPRADAVWQTPSYVQEHSNYVMSAERQYEVDEQTGLRSLEMRSSLQYRTDNHVLNVAADLELYYESSKPNDALEKLRINETSVHYQYQNYSNPTNGIRKPSQDELKNKTYDMLLNIATKGIDADNIVRNASFIHSLDFIYLLTTMSQLQYPSLKQLFIDVLGTSYELETARNLFLEMLPYVRNEAAARLIKHLVVEQKSKIEDATLLTLIRKLPFNLINYNRPLLEELEVFTKLGVDFPQEIRHAGILSFATLLGNALDAEFDQQYFDDIHDKYLRMYNYFPQYLDRLVWLQGLTNIGKGVVHYLDDIHTDPKKDRHERLWTGLASLSIWKESSLSNVLPIITNSTEHIQLRVLALHAFLSSGQTSRDFLNLHYYIQSCNDGQLKKFWYSTLKSLEKNRFYYRYKTASHFVPFVANQLFNPGPQYWATNNYIISQEPSLDVQGPTFQLLTVGGQWTGPPELVVVEFSTGGQRPFNAALYILAEGIPQYAFRRLQNFNVTSITEELRKILQNMKVELLEPEKIHIDIVVKVQDKTVYATHINQERFDKWNAEDLKNSIEDFVRFGSHINQQMVYYPIQMAKDFATEIGTPIRLHSTIVSFTSLRGNLTAPSTDENISWRNDLHIRYQGTAVTSLSTDGPLQECGHTARIQQSMVLHLPIKVDISFSLPNRTLELKWTNPAQNGGIAMHSRTQVGLECDMEEQQINTYINTIKVKSKQTEDDGIFFDCEQPMSGSELSELLTSNSYSLLTSLHPSQIILNSIQLITSPTPGSCGLILPPRQLQTGNKFSVEFKLEDLISNDEEYMQIIGAKVGFGLKYFREAEEGMEADSFLTVRGTAEFLTDGANGNFSVQLSGFQPHAKDEQRRNWTICFLEQHNLRIVKNDLIFSHLPQSFSGGVNFNYSFAPDFACFHSEPTGYFEAKYDVDSSRESVDIDRNWYIEVTGKNLFQLFEGTMFEEEIKLLKLNKKFNKLPVISEIPLHVTIHERDDEILFQVNGTEMEFRNRDYTFIPPSWNHMQILRKLGFYHECYIKKTNARSKLVRTFSGTMGALSSFTADGLAVGDCTNNPRFAVFISPQARVGGVTVYAGGQVIKYSKYGFRLSDSSEHEDDLQDTAFRISRDGHLLRTSDGIHIYHESGDTIILVPQLYMDTVCGDCMGQIV